MQLRNSKSRQERRHLRWGPIIHLTLWDQDTSGQWSNESV